MGAVRGLASCKLDLVGVQEVRGDNENENYQLGTAYFVKHVILSAVNP